ncbi:MAG: undecaprenyl-diphosphate phosphatase [Candidatus Hydrothermia bacterium]
MKEIVIGIIQGITEFLPVSSSGHLVLFQKLLKASKPGIEFEIFLHFSTLLAVVVFFWKDVKSLFVKESLKRHPITLLVVGSIPAGIVGILFKDRIEAYFENITYLPYFFIITSILLFSTFFKKNPDKKDITLLHAFLIGIAQAVAILPGVSRSGATISTAILLGITHETAFSFSFILSLPAILGAALIDLKDANLPLLLNYIPAGITAFIFGLISLYVLKKVLRIKKLFLFGFYTLLLAIITFFLR